MQVDELHFTQEQMCKAITYYLNEEVMKQEVTVASVRLNPQGNFIADLTAVPEAR